MTARRYLVLIRRSTTGSTDGRQHHLQGALRCCRRKRGAKKQAIGRSRGGRTTKIHAVADASCRLMGFHPTSDQMGDVRYAEGLIGKQPQAARVLADTAYDSDKFREFLQARGSVLDNTPTDTTNSQEISRQPSLSPYSSNGGFKGVRSLRRPDRRCQLDTSARMPAFARKGVGRDRKTAPRRTARRRAGRQTGQHHYRDDREHPSPDHPAHHPKDRSGPRAAARIGVAVLALYPAHKNPWSGSAARGWSC